MDKNVFESSNARDMTTKQLASEFIWTNTFERLFSKRNHIILGARGTGKTAFAKMLAFDGLSQYTDERAKKIIRNKQFIATFVPFKPEFLAKLKTIQIDSQLEDFFFIWGVNLSSSSRFLNVAKHCVRAYSKNSIESAQHEKNISISLGQHWLGEKHTTFNSIDKSLSLLEFDKNYSFNKAALGFNLTHDDFKVGEKFHTDLFSPLKLGIDTLKRELDISDETTWAICLDEAEVLNENQWKIVNTQLRTYTEVVFKITTMPYKHKTLKTNLDENLNPKHDFDYLYLDRLGTIDKAQKDADRIILDFAEKLFLKKVSGSNLYNSGITLKMLLGNSDLTDNSATIVPNDKLMTLIERYCNEATVTRAKRLYGRNPKGKSFSDEIERKLRPFLIIKDYIESTTGQGYAAPKIFSGYDVAVKCCDGNPRKLINLFNRFITSLNPGIGFSPIEKGKQGRIIKSFSISEIDSIRAEENGLKAANFLTQVGNYFKGALHNEKIGTEINLSFDFDLDDKSMWESVRIAVDLGLLVPHITTADGDDNMPVMSGRFHFSGSICPQFFLPPRRGGVLKLSTILRRISSSSIRNVDSSGSNQLEMFNE
ncbi:hypothetical protein [Alteromonas sp. BZK5]|uniref:ORC-CDC6 family AAA ATPase n=1 Tax=Alteromonas sp. BZK5 TaxID=1904459 RepID=UPI0016535E94|nr:hypothetical protein [Alteromonas sp. BZK5]MBC6986176.1 hypothetical protein [Alteromonas sp. BZK5]MEC7689348.1 hypothetical protein [Pseudomonadota bacterium]